MQKRDRADFSMTLLQDGNVELNFLQADGTNFGAILPPDQIGQIATALLSAAHASAQLVGPSPLPAQPGPMPISNGIPVNYWYFGDLPTPEQKAIIVQIGHTKIGFGISGDQMRGLGRNLIGASWKTGTTHPAFWELLKELVADLHLWCVLVWSRLKSKWKTHYSDFSTWLSGRGFQRFSVIHIGPGLTAPEYSPFGGCIYCDAKVYSQIPHIRKFPFGAEHVIAEGLGGTLELPEASCQDCEKATGAVVEGDVLGRFMKAIRVHLRLKKAGSGPLPKTLPLEATVLGQKKRVEIPIEDYPIMLGMFAYASPDLDKAEGMPLVTRVTFVRLKHDAQLLFQKYGIASFATAYLDNVMMCRMLAKIGHALAVAELGRDRFKRLLTDLIRSGINRLDMKYVGGASQPLARVGGPLHAVALGYRKIKKTTYVVARIQLFASHGGPTYEVIVGPSLESSIARFRRVFQARKMG
jgi:hypothetical protein